MPRAIISPSVLASDFGQLTAECSRMINDGAEWLHMGQCAYIIFYLKFTDVVCQMSWTGDFYSYQNLIQHALYSSIPSHFVPNITMGAPILTCVHKNIPDIFMDCHMMVAQPEKVLVS